MPGGAECLSEGRYCFQTQDRNDRRHTILPVSVIRAAVGRTAFTTSSMVKTSTVSAMPADAIFTKSAVKPLPFRHGDIRHNLFPR